MQHERAARQSFEKVFSEDCLSKRERVQRAIDHQPVDRAVLHEQLSYNTAVVSHFAGRQFSEFGFAPQHVGMAVRRSLDTCFPIFEMKGTDTVTTSDGFAVKNDNWTSWRVGRPFDDEHGAAGWLEARIAAMERTGFNEHTAVNVDGKEEHLAERRFSAETVREEYRSYFLGLQELVGETVIIDFSFTGFCDLYDAMGLEIFTFFCLDYPQLLRTYMEVSIHNELQRVEAIADPELSPLILIPEDMATKRGPIFPPDFLDEFHFPYVRQLTEAWHRNGLRVIYHSDGNYKSVIPQLMDCGVDGFYCLEPACGMDIVELKRTWPGVVWAGGLDGVDLMEQGTPDMVRAEVIRQIRETRAVETGGIFLATSSEINPTTRVENFLAMVEAVGELRNPDFCDREGSAGSHGS
jgi:hypothetical protein